MGLKGSNMIHNNNLTTSNLLHSQHLSDDQHGMYEAEGAGIRASTRQEAWGVGVSTRAGAS